MSKLEEKPLNPIWIVSQKKVLTQTGEIQNNLEVHQTFLNKLSDHCLNRYNLRDGKNMIQNKYEIANTFNEHYVDIVEKAVAINL